MKRLILTLTAVAFLIAPVSAFAQTDLPNPGITPDSPFYFLDLWGERLVDLLAFSDEVSVDTAIAQAEERLAEAEAMADQGSDELADQARQRYQERIETALQRATQAREQVREQVMEQVAEATSKHFGVLQSRLEEAPQEAQEGLQKALESSSQGLESSLEALSQEKRGEIMQNLQDSLPNLDERIQKGGQEGKKDLDVLKEELQNAIKDSGGRNGQ